MNLLETIKTARRRLQSGRLKHEQQVKNAVIEPVLISLGWDVGDIYQVVPEFDISKGRVDYALLGADGLPLVLIETKAHNKITDKGRDQLFEYAYEASREGVGIIILTDGQKWEFYLVHMAGVRAEDRLFYKLDLIGTDLEECEEKLSRYLSQENIYNGEAFGSAKEDFDTRRDTERRKQQEKRDREKLKASLPNVWEELKQDQTSPLYELMSRAIANAGLKGYPEVLAEFVSRLGPRQVSPTNEPTPQRPQTSYVSEQPAPIYPKVGDRTKAPRSKIVGYTLYGKRYSTSRWIEVLIGVLNEFIARDPEFVSNFRRAHPRYWTNRRQLIADRQGEVYLKASHLTRVARQLNNGQWVDTNLGQIGIVSRIKDACAVMGLRYGVDFVLHEEHS